MAEVDVSSYKQPAVPSFLDVASKLGGLQQQQQQIQSGGLTIQKQQLDLVNQRFATLAKQLTSLANKPDLSEKDIVGQIQNDVQLGILPADMAGKLQAQIPPNANPAQLKTHIETLMTNAQGIIDAVNFHYGTPGTISNQQQIQPVVTSPKFGMKGTGPGIQIQPAPETPIPTDTGVNQLGPAAYPGTSSQPLPVGPVRTNIQGQSSNFGGNVTGATVGPDTGGMPVVKPAMAGGPTGPQIGRSPLFETGKEQYVQDQNLATQKLTAIKPALQALPLLKGIMAGPGTAPFTHAVASLKAFGIIPTGVNDPIAQRQEVVKKLNQYIQSSPAGQRSDAAQTLAEASSPTPNVQIAPALIKLTKDAIILDRVQAARAAAFEGGDFSKYGQHASTFPARVDEKAFGLDVMEPNERQSLLDDMKKKANTFEGKKFWKSLALVKKLNLYNVSGE